MKRNALAVAAVILALGAYLGIGAFVTEPARNMSYAEDGTSISAAVNTDSHFHSALYANYYEDIAENFAGDIPIPGLRKTVTMKAPSADVVKDYLKKRDETKQFDQEELTTCDEMTPQGIAVTDDFIFVSAYCGGHEHDSVIYMIKKSTGEYLKTIALAGTTHAGGIVYVPQADGIWVTTNQTTSKDTCQIALISMDDIEGYDMSLSKRPVEYTAWLEIPQLKAASSIGYADDHLIIGHFEATDDAYVYCLPLDEWGAPQFDETASNPNDWKVDTEKSKSGITEEQGVCVDEEGNVYLSISWGPTEGVVSVTKLSDAGIEDIVDNMKNRWMGFVWTPAYVEQVVCDDDYLYMVFEGAAKKYRERDVDLHVDRIVKIDRKKLTKKLQAHSDYLYDLIEQYDSKEADVEKKVDDATMDAEKADKAENSATADTGTSTDSSQ